MASSSLINTLILTLIATSSTVAQFSLPHPGVGVQLFQWRFADIATECTNFLGPNGYSWVQTSPVQQHVSNTYDAYASQHPWYEAYQPLGYKIGNRLGSLADFTNMVAVCKAAKVDIVVDVVLNHNAYVSETYVGGYSTTSTSVTTPFSESVPDPGYNSSHYHTSICNQNLVTAADFANDNLVYNCRLSTLIDLKTESPFVRQSITAFLNNLLSLGVVGFRVDAAKHVPQADWQVIFGGLNKNSYGSPAYLSLELSGQYGDGTYKSYPSIGNLIGFDYARNLGMTFRNMNGKTTDQLASVVSSSAATAPGTSITSILENHDEERSGDGASNFALSRLNGGWWYKQAAAFQLLYPYGSSSPLVHSGYAFTWNGGSTPETPVSAPFIAGTGMIAPIAPIINNTCTSYMCQHRYSDIFALVPVRNWINRNGQVAQPTLSNLGAGSNQVYWSFSGSAFILINSAQNGQAYQNAGFQVQTNLAQGIYCNAVYAYATSTGCDLWPGTSLVNGEQFQYIVNSNGFTWVNVLQADHSRVLVLYSGANGLVSSNISPAVYGGVSVNVKVSTSSSAYDGVYIVGTFNNWSTCSAIPCSFVSGTIFNCGNINVAPGSAVQWKPIHFGTSTSTRCAAPIYASGNNNAFTASSGLVVTGTL